MSVSTLFEVAANEYETKVAIFIHRHAQFVDEIVFIQIVSTFTEIFAFLVLSHALFRGNFHKDRLGSVQSARQQIALKGRQR